MVQAIFDSECTKSIILKEFTEKKRRTKLPTEEQGKYEMCDNFLNKIFLSKVNESIKASIYVQPKISSNSLFFMKEKLFFFSFDIQLFPCLFIVEETQIVINAIEENHIF